MSCRRGATLVELSLGGALVAVILALVLAGSRLIGRAQHEALTKSGKASHLALTLETVLREIRTARRVVLPSPGSDAFGQPSPSLPVCYFVNERRECVLLRVLDGRLTRSVLGASGQRSEDTIDSGLSRARFRTQPGAPPRIQVALARDGVVVVGQAAALNATRPAYVQSRGAVHEL